MVAYGEDLSTSGLRGACFDPDAVGSGDEAVLDRGRSEPVSVDSGARDTAQRLADWDRAADGWRVPCAAGRAARPASADLPAGGTPARTRQPALGRRARSSSPGLESGADHAHTGSY